MRIQRSYLAFLVCAVGGFAATRPAASVVEGQSALKRLPLRFEANQGQWSPEIRYMARSGAGHLLLTQQGPTLASGSHRIDLRLTGSNPAARVEGLERLAAHADYYVGNRDQWRTGVASFSRVAYRSVYPGIDVIYYGTDAQLEYDFVVQPGADPRAIRLRFRGADHVRLTADGALEVQSGDAQLMQKRPVVYQQDPRTGARQAVDARYEVGANGMVRMQLGPYRAELPLVIDPVVSYFVFLGGASTDVVNTVTSDANGLLYVAGYTQSPNLFIGGNAAQTAYSAGIDGFVTILDPTKTGADSLVYTSYLGGGRDDYITAMTVDSNGLIYLTGKTTSSDFPLAGANVQTTLALSSSSTSSVFPFDAFVTLISPANGFAYSTYYGGTGNETPNGIVFDSQGMIYILGTTDSTDLPVTANSYSATISGTTDIFVAEINRNSTELVYGSYLGGEADDDGRGLAIGPTGLLYFDATTASQKFPMAGSSYQPNLRGFENLAVGVLDLTQQGAAALVYSSYLGGSVADEARGLSLDSKGRLLVTGWTLSNDFPITLDAMEGIYGGSGNGFVVRVNPAAPPEAFVEYGTYIGGSGGDVGYGVTSDASGVIYVTGYTMSPDFPVTAGAAEGQYANGIEAFLVELNPKVAGREALLYGSYFGATGVHVGTSLVLAPSGAVYIGGYTGADMQLPAQQNLFAGGGSDGFLVVLK